MQPNSAVTVHVIWIISLSSANVSTILNTHLNNCSTVIVVTTFCSLFPLFCPLRSGCRDNLYQDLTISPAPSTTSTNKFFPWSLCYNVYFSCKTRPVTHSTEGNDLVSYLLLFTAIFSIHSLARCISRHIWHILALKCYSEVVENSLRELQVEQKSLQSFLRIRRLFPSSALVALMYTMLPLWSCASSPTSDLLRNQTCSR